LSLSFPGSITGYSGDKDPGAEGESEFVPCHVYSINPGSWTEITGFPESLTRKLYRKKIPEITIVLSNCPEEKSIWTKWTKGTVFPESLTRKVYRKKIPEIVIVLSNLSKVQE
jgi:hypothetical protein